MRFFVIQFGAQCQCKIVVKIAKCLQMAVDGATRREIFLAVESSYKTIASWLKAYKDKGLKGFDFGLEDFGWRSRFSAAIKTAT